MLRLTRNMNARPSVFAVLLLGLTTATGCVSRAAPFNDLSESDLTVVKLSADQPQQANPQFGGLPIPAIPIPGMTPEQQAQLQQQFQQGAQQIAQGLGIPLPGVPGMTPAPQQQRLNGFLVVTSVQGEDALKEELLDLFGDEESFTPNAPPNCFTPGMAFIFSPRDGSPNFEIMVSHSCNQLRANGFEWPYQSSSGFTPETAAKLRNVYTRLWGQPPGQGS